MADLEIPIDGNLEVQVFEISLDSVLYNLRFVWSIRETSWFMDIISNQNIILLQGIKIEVDWMPVFRYKIAGLPPGNFIVVDTSGLGISITEMTDFGTDNRVKLVYQEADA